MNRKIILVAILVVALAVSVYFLVVENRGTERNQLLSLSLEPQIKEADGISFEAIPLDFDLGNPVKFEIKINTHSGSLDFDLTKISFLEDDMGNKYMPSGWQGSASGGHHLSGILSFPKLTAAAKELGLIIQKEPPITLKWSL